jgi:hypothetical protein
MRPKFHFGNAILIGTKPEGTQPRANRFARDDP